MEHPHVRNANYIQEERLSATERFCRRVATATGAPVTLVLVIVFQIIWILIGQGTRRDPFPFIFMLTVSNVVQLVLIVVLAVAGRQQAQHSEIRAEEDHRSLTHIATAVDDILALVQKPRRAPVKSRKQPARR